MSKRPWELVPRVEATSTSQGRHLERRRGKGPSIKIHSRTSRETLISRPRRISSHIDLGKRFEFRLKRLKRSNWKKT